MLPSGYCGILSLRVVSVIMDVSGLLLLMVVLSEGVVVVGSGVSQAIMPVITIAKMVITVFIIEIF
jgi:hypothetical protein